MKRDAGRGAGQVQRHRQVPSRRAAAPGQTAVRGHCRSRGPGLRGRAGPAGRDLYRVSAGRAGSVTRHPQARPRPAGDVAAGRRGRIADMTTVMLPADLAAVSSLPLAGQRAAPAGYALRGRWRVRRSRAARNSRFWCLSFAGLLLHRSRCLRCSGPLADSCPRQGEILSLAVACCWRLSQRGWQQGRGQRASLARGNRARAVAGLSGQPDGAHGASEASPASEPFRLVEPQLVQARGYRGQFLPFSSACLINGRVVTCSCRSRSAVLI